MTGADWFLAVFEYAIVGFFVAFVRVALVAASGTITPASARTGIVALVAWPIVGLALALAGAWRLARWLVSDLSWPKRERTDDPRAGYRDSARSAGEP